MPRRSVGTRPRGRAKRTVKCQTIELITQEQSEIPPQLPVRHAACVCVLIGLRLRRHSRNSWQNLAIARVADVAIHIPQPAYRSGNRQADYVAACSQKES